LVDITRPQKAFVILWGKM